MWYIKAIKRSSVSASFALCNTRKSWSSIEILKKRVLISIMAVRYLHLDISKAPISFSMCRSPRDCLLVLRHRRKWLSLLGQHSSPPSLTAVRYLFFDWEHSKFLLRNKWKIFPGVSCFSFPLHSLFFGGASSPIFTAGFVHCAFRHSLPNFTGTFRASIFLQTLRFFPRSKVLRTLQVSHGWSLILTCFSQPFSSAPFPPLSFSKHRSVLPRLCFSSTIVKPSLSYVESLVSSGDTSRRKWI